MTEHAPRLIERLAAAVWQGPVPPAARDGDGFGFLVDGAPIAVRPQGRLVRLECALAPGLPAEEGAARALLAAFLPFADAGPELLCTDTDGRVLLIADLDPETEAVPAIARFADAAVYWMHRFAPVAETTTSRPLPPGPVIFYP